MRIRLHGVHFLRDATHEVSIRVVDDHGNLILQCSAYCDGPCYAPFTSHEDNTAAECASFCDLAVEAAIDGIALSAPLKPPYGADVERRKIVPRIVQIDEHVAVALSFQVSPDDREGYRARLTAFMQDHDPSNVSAVDDIMSSMSEINAFSFAWNEYGAESINDRLQHVANRYGLDDEIVEACVGELGSQEPEQWLETFVEFMLVNATLEANDLSHGSRALAMIRKYALNEDEVMTSMNDAEDPDDFIHELQSVFGPEPRLIDTAAYPVGSMSPRRAKPAQAPQPQQVAPAAPATTAADSLDRRAASDDHVAPEQEHQVDPNRYNSDDAHRYDSEVDAHHQFHEVAAPPQADNDNTHHAAPPSYEAYNSEEGEAFLAAEASPYMPVRARTPEGPADATHDDPFEVPSQQVRPVSPPQPLPVQPPETDATANEESEPLREPTDISHWAVPTASTGDAPADTTDAAVLRQSLLHMGRERDQLEAQLGELRHSTTQAAIAAQEEIDRLQRRVQELDEAVLGYRLSTEEALRRMEEAETARASTQAALDDATEQIVNLKKSQARLCQAIETPGARIRLQVLFDEVEMLIPANVNVCLGDVRRAVIQRAIKLGVLSEEAVERRNLQLMLGKTVLYDDDTIEEMAIEATDRITVCELGAIVFANDPKPTAGSLPVVGGASSAAVSSPQAAAEPPQPTVYKPFVVPLSPEVSNDLCSHESLERRLLSERQRIEHDDLLQQEKRAFDAKIKLILDKARMRLVDRAAYGRSDDARAQARAAVARIDSAMRAGLSPDAMLGLARHADLTSEAMAAAEQRASTSSSSMGPVSSGDVTAVPNEMAARIEKRRAQCVSDLREMIDTLSHRVAIPPARLVDAEALVSKARSYVSLASSLSVEELQQCLRDIVNFMNQVRR